jgi:hypothetical protein
LTSRHRGQPQVNKVLLGSMRYPEHETAGG